MIRSFCRENRRNRERRKYSVVNSDNNLGSIHIFRVGNNALTIRSNVGDIEAGNLFSGKLIVRTLKEDDDDDEEEPFDEEMEDEANSSFSEAQPNSEDMSGDSSIEREEDTSSKSDYLDFFDANLKPTEENVKSTDGFIEHPIMNPGALKPDVSEVQKQSSRETLSYLKAKRIIRHKNHDGEMEPKKFKAN